MGLGGEDSLEKRHHNVGKENGGGRGNVSGISCFNPLSSTMNS